MIRNWEEIRLIFKNQTIKIQESPNEHKIYLLKIEKLFEGMGLAIKVNYYNNLCLRCKFF